MKALALIFILLSVTAQSADAADNVDRIRSRWTRPAGTKEIATVTASVSAQTGRIEDVKVTAPSGSEAVDQAAIEAVKRAAPLIPGDSSVTFTTPAAQESKPEAVRVSSDSAAPGDKKPAYKGPSIMKRLLGGSGAPVIYVIPVGGVGGPGCYY